MKIWKEWFRPRVCRIEWHNAISDPTFAMPELVVLEHGNKRLLQPISLSYYTKVGRAQHAIFDCAFVKITEGTTLVDSKCAAHISWCLDWDKDFIIYHFAGHGAPEAEADFFVSKIQDYLECANGLMLDWEDDRDIAWIETWLDRVYELTNLKPALCMTRQVYTTAKWHNIVARGYTILYPSRAARQSSKYQCLPLQSNLKKRCNAQ